MTNNNEGIVTVFRVAPDLASEFTQGDMTNMTDVGRHAFNALYYQIKHENSRHLYAHGIEFRITMEPFKAEATI